jgi:Cu/Zn superoxide dismutase
MAQATIAPFGDGTVKGTATFTQMGTDTLLVVNLTDCPEGVHPLHIHAGTGCGSTNEQGSHWDVPRGEMIGGNSLITCNADKTGTLTYTRSGAMANLKWTVGDGSATDPIGHPFVIHDVGAAATNRVGCGLIVAKP